MSCQLQTNHEDKKTIDLFRTLAMKGCFRQYDINNDICRNECNTSRLCEMASNELDEDDLSEILCC